MRILLILTACLLASLLALQFAGEARPARPFESLTITVICGSDESSGLDQAVYNGVVAAEADLGCDVDFRPAPWQGDRAAAVFQQVMSGVPDGICIMGYPAQDLMRSYMEDAREQEIVITSYNTPYAAAEAQYGLDGFGFAGSDGYRAGYELISAAIKKHGLKPGDVALLLGDVEHPARARFLDGCLAALEPGGLRADRVQITTAQLYDAPGELSDLLARRKAAGTLPDLICFTEHALSSAVRRVRDAGIDPGEIPLVGFGITPNIDDWMRPNEQQYVSLFVGQDVTLQAYLAILQACMGKVYGAQGLHINTPFDIVDCDAAPVAAVDLQSPLFVQRY